MADYQCFPLWLQPPAGIGNLPVGDLPISQELAVDLSVWAQDYDRTLNREFVVRGENLARRLARELGPGCSVTYFDNDTSEVRLIS
ncbi:hypothetical protein [Lentzea sp. NBRC 105346]|uniref:hypothetical protein n=1 Tax=Lentzea sp. NBRC 105346 TaxID=3032205 RepID=UPI002553657F|nr:hypothetical protein [Lentzea sp. NBRC 105346]